MTSPFRRTYHSDEEIANHRAERNAAKVARILEGLPEPRAPELIKTTVAAIERNRIQEIDAITDVGWGDPEAIRLMKHHAREATSAAKNYSSTWDVRSQRSISGGFKNLTTPVRKMIKGHRDRVNPALHVAEAEFDGGRILRKRYTEIEAAHLNEVDAIKSRFDALRAGASKEARSKIWQLERYKLQVVLDSMASAVSEWEMDLNDACQDVGY